jgi:hypothetical protein
MTLSPLLQVEFTLIQSGVDFYDISILNGFNVPVEFSPVQPFTLDSNKPYDCGNPGHSLDSDIPLVPLPYLIFPSIVSQVVVSLSLVMAPVHGISTLLAQSSNGSKREMKISSLIAPLILLAVLFLARLVVCQSMVS